MVNGTIEVGKFDEAVRTAYLLSDDCKLYFDPNRIYIPTIDGSNSAFTKIRLDKSAFATYGDEKLTIGASLEKIKNILTNSPSDSTLYIDFDRTDGRLDFEVNGQQFMISQVDLDSIKSDIPDPDVDYSAEVTIAEEDLSRSIKGADIMNADRMTFIYNSDSGIFRMEARGDSDITMQEMNSDELIDVEGTSAEVVFSHTFLEILRKSLPKAVEITILLENDRPGLFKFDVVNGAGTVEFMIAPIIDPN